MGIGLQDYEELLDRLHAAKQQLDKCISMARWAAGPAAGPLIAFAYQVQATLLEAPVVVRFWHTAQGWTGVRAEVASVAAELSDGNPRRTIHDHWAGFAADNYYRIVPIHQAAAHELGIVADKMQHALTWTAQAAFAFYAMVLTQTLVIIAALIAALSELASVVGALTAMVTLAAAAVAALAELAEGVTAAGIAYVWAKVFVYDVRSELNDTTAFPGHAWPVSHSAGYRDGTVTDGDAEWSLRHG